MNRNRLKKLGTIVRDWGSSWRVLPEVVEDEIKAQNGYKKRGEWAFLFNSQVCVALMSRAVEYSAEDEAEKAKEVLRGLLAHQEGLQLRPHGDYEYLSGQGVAGASEAVPEVDVDALLTFTASGLRYWVYDLGFTFTGEREEDWLEKWRKSLNKAHPRGYDAGKFDAIREAYDLKNSGAEAQLKHAPPEVQDAVRFAHLFTSTEERAVAFYPGTSQEACRRAYKLMYGSAGRWIGSAPYGYEIYICEDYRNV